MWLSAFAAIGFPLTINFIPLILFTSSDEVFLKRIPELVTWYFVPFSLLFGFLAAPYVIRARGKAILVAIGLLLPLIISFATVSLGYILFESTNFNYPAVLEGLKMGLGAVILCVFFVTPLILGLIAVSTFRCFLKNNLTNASTGASR